MYIIDWDWVGAPFRMMLEKPVNDYEVGIL